MMVKGFLPLHILDGAKGLERGAKTAVQVERVGPGRAVKLPSFAYLPLVTRWLGKICRFLFGRD